MLASPRRRWFPLKAASAEIERPRAALSARRSYQSRGRRDAHGAPVRPNHHLRAVAIAIEVRLAGLRIEGKVIPADAIVVLRIRPAAEGVLIEIFRICGGGPAAGERANADRERKTRGHEDLHCVLTPPTQRSVSSFRRQAEGFAAV